MANAIISNYLADTSPVSVDSGASFHITFKISVFVTYTLTFATSVK